MSDKPVSDRYHACIAPLAASSVAKAGQCVLSYGHNGADLARVRQTLTLPAALERFYEQADSMQIRWRLQQGAAIEYLDREIDIVGGEANVLPVSTCVDGIDGRRGAELLDPYGSFPEARELLDRLAPFDYCEGEFAVCFEMESGRVLDRLHFVPLDGVGEIRPLPVGVEDYLQRGFAMRFIHHWVEAAFFDSPDWTAFSKHYLAQVFGSE
ncbi:hypothetical protein HV824_32760 [Myxococcus sp. AM009]|uniref:hypothetical protein n=1 Tax=unclassified Myxococcus TaxID=2648731 RepID=UPI0015953729|nr:MULTISPECIES: hypothetical protein [unclassified Myxococcus]NVJ02860.1 hypothetical protein [Myxococcus sp. AM009]NVJ17538.1 hypothetical protein [Myxococcus sp. AM010]